MAYKPRILIIDDNIANIKILRETLGNEMTILFAQDARYGISSAIENQPELILLDILMPKMDGYQVCRELKGDPRTVGIPVIFISSMSGEADEAMGFEMGAVDYIIKPFLPSITKARIRTQLALATQTRALKKLHGDLETQKLELAFANSILEKLRFDATQKLDIRSQFFQEASHDFKQRLHAIQVLVHAAQLGNPVDVPSHMVKISNALASIKKYVADFLEFTQLETSILNLNLARVYLQDLFQNLSLEFEEIAIANKVDLRIRTTNIALTTDRELLYRILENLVSNAIKFSRGRVLVVARKLSKGLSLEVWDDGPGIPFEKREIVFDAFYKEHLDGNYQEGVGLGLSIVKRLSNSLQCPVSIHSLGSGSNAFKILIPQSSLN